MRINTPRKQNSTLRVRTACRPHTSSTVNQRASPTSLGATSADEASLHISPRTVVDEPARDADPSNCRDRFHGTNHARRDCHHGAGMAPSSSRLHGLDRTPGRAVECAVQGILESPDAIPAWRVGVPSRQGGLACLNRRVLPQRLCRTCPDCQKAQPFGCWVS